MERSAEIKDIAAALAKAQSEMTGAAKDAVNPHFKNKYATLASAWDACRGPLSKNQISVSQGVSTTADGATVVTTLLAHSSGQWLQDSIACVPQQKTPQGIGSAITYMRRYALMAMVGIAPDDDDGEAGSQQMAPAQTPARPSRPSKEPYPLVDQYGEESEHATAEAFAEALKTAFKNADSVDTLSGIIESNRAALDRLNAENAKVASELRQAYTTASKAFKEVSVIVDILDEDGNVVGNSGNLKGWFKGLVDAVNASTSPQGVLERNKNGVSAWQKIDHAEATKLYSQIAAQMKVAAE